jgi:phosphoenolpyruvate carboxykinase (ATP)
VEVTIEDEKIKVPRAVFEERNGKKKPMGGTGPSIEETELFLHQAARGAVVYEPHPIWGNKVLVPVKVPGISDERLKELNPFTYHSVEEMRRMLRAQILQSKHELSTQCPGLSKRILSAMDF